MKPIYFFTQLTTPDGASLGTEEEMQEAAVSEESFSILELMMEGGYVMIPIAICSIIAIYITIERFMAIKKSSKEPENFMNNIKDFISEGKIDAAKALCKSTDNPIARMIEKGIARIGKPLNDIEKAIENVGNIEVVKMERGMSALGTVAAAAPMIGFLGTVLGMVRAFYDMKTEYERTQESINIGVLSGGMYEAMMTTVGGLIVGIVALICYNMISSMIKKVIFKMESSSIEFMDLLQEPAN